MKETPSRAAVQADTATSHRSAPSQLKHQMQSRILLDAIVAQRLTVLYLPSRVDDSLLRRRKSLLDPNLGLDCEVGEERGEHCAASRPCTIV